jgi:hypothetical protein
MRLAAALALLLLSALACGDPARPERPAETPPAADIETPKPPTEEPPAETPPPGGWIADGVIYARDGSVYGCVGGGNSCAGPPAGFTEQEDLCESVDAIRDAELAWKDEHHTWKLVKPTPRRAHDLDGKAVDWPKRSGFAELGWSPGPRTQGAWWVAAAGDGIEIHGLIRDDKGWRHCFATDMATAVDTPWRE